MLVLSICLDHLGILVLSIGMVHFQILILSIDMVHLVILVLSSRMVHSTSMSLSFRMVHTEYMALSVNWFTLIFCYTLSIKIHSKELVHFIILDHSFVLSLSRSMNHSRMLVLSIMNGYALA